MVKYTTMMSPHAIGQKCVTRIDEDDLFLSMCLSRNEYILRHQKTLKKMARGLLPSSLLHDVAERMMTSILEHAL